MAVLLLLVTIALYWPATRNDFVNHDDRDYVTANVHVQNGLTLENIKWAFMNPVPQLASLDGVVPYVGLPAFRVEAVGTSPDQPFAACIQHSSGLSAASQHDGRVWRSVLVAALFGLHPLHVESVAWVAERKDVLSGFFGLLALIFYARYARTTIGNREIGNLIIIAGLLFFFALGLMSKPMLVTWPFVMLLLDYWPLKRIRNSEFGIRDFIKLLLEKIPFFVLAAAASAVTFMVQKQGGAVMRLKTCHLARASGTP